VSTEPEREVQLPPDEPVGHVLSFDAGRPSARAVLQSSTLITVAALVGNGFNVVFHFATARLMGPQEYSLLATMFAVFLIASVPLLALQATVARETSAVLARGDERGAGMILRSSFRVVFRVAVIAVIVATVLFFPLVSVLHVGRLLPVVAVIVAFFVQIPIPLASGALQASERFGVLAASQSLQSGLKLVAGVALAALGFGASAVTFGFAAATAVSFGIMLVFLRPYLEQAHGAPIPARTLLGGYAAGAAIALGMHTVLVNTDLIWARGALNPDEAGLYAAASVTTSVILLIPIGVTTVLFPRVARLRREEKGGAHLTFGLALVAALAAVAVAVLAAIPRFLLEVLFGHKYVDAAPWLAPLGVAMAFYALAIVYLNHSLALGRATIAYVLVGVVAVQQVLFLVFHASPWQIVWVQVATSVLLVAACEVFHRADRTRS
jgi:O-antigen/teichoic acid export membrane protein